MNNDSKPLPREEDGSKFSEKSIKILLHADINGTKILSGDSQERGKASRGGGRAHDALCTTGSTLHRNGINNDINCCERPGRSKTPGKHNSMSPKTMIWSDGR